jgi:hypothetical protein
MAAFKANHLKVVDLMGYAGLTPIGVQAFDGQEGSSLTTVYLPDSIAKTNGIQDRAFGSNNKLTDLRLGLNLEFNDLAFGDYTSKFWTDGYSKPAVGNKRAGYYTWGYPSPGWNYTSTQPAVLPPRP